MTIYNSTFLAANSEVFVGSKECVSCHQKQFDEWRTSDHSKSMAEATKDSVLGNFNDYKVIFHNVENIFYIENEKYWVKITDPDGNIETHQILYTFGHWPLQQYLVETNNGHIQVFNVAWDSRKKTDNGQKWFHLRPEENINPEHIFFWKRHFQNWNSRCADCHSTNMEKRYDPVKHAYDTKWSEINVACEACHGPASEHVKLAESNQITAQDNGFTQKASEPLSWSFNKTDPIAKPKGTKNKNELNMCGSCHSHRTQLQTKSQGINFHDSSRLQLLNQNSYFSDGQIREEVFVLGSFLQSKMHAQGVTCSNCHNPHSGKVLIEGNGLCNQCHLPQRYNTREHHQHDLESTGAVCVNCHMPNRTYMQVDDRRDHNFNIPRPGLSLELGVPNACVSCHDQKQNSWASKELLMWGVNPIADHWSKLKYRAQLSDVLVTLPLTNIVKDGALPDIISASLLQQLSNMPTRASINVAQSKLNDPSPLIRRAAVIALQALSAESRWQLLSSHLKDDSRSVRYQIAETLADVLLQLPIEKQTELSVLINEYRDTLNVTSDSPITQLAIATLEFKLGNNQESEKAYIQALRIEPNFLPALLNLADFYRGLSQGIKSKELYKRALKIAPDSAVTWHSYGLFLIRQKEYEKSLSYLKMATEQTDSLPRYAYVYAIALDNNKQTNEAIKVLVRANEQWPNQYDLLMTLVSYLEKTGNITNVLQYVSALTAIAPDDQNVKKLFNRYNK